MSRQAEKTMMKTNDFVLYSVLYQNEGYMTAWIW